MPAAWGFRCCILSVALSVAQAGYGASDGPLWSYITMPFFSAIVGYGTNVIALKMTFYPLDFIGCFQIPESPLGCGWQGIVPSKARKMAATATDLITSQLLNVRAVFQRVDPQKMSDALSPGLLVALSKIVVDMGASLAPQAWAALPADVKDECVLGALECSEVLVQSLLRDVTDDVDEVLDLKAMVVELMVENKALLNKMFLDVGGSEIIFIERSGFYFGFLFGLLQTLLWWYYPASWVLPVGGFLVGYLTNWLALKIIFRPVQPHNVCGFRIQGIFLQRQLEVSKTFAQILAAAVLTPENMWKSILTGPKSHIFREKCRRHISQGLDAAVGRIGPFLPALLGVEEFYDIKEAVADRILRELPEILRYGNAYVVSALRLETSIREAMESLPSADFESVLHPVFEEDELKLIVIGGVLGAAVGIIQFVAIFA